MLASSREKGFTLVEIMIVVAIIGLLASIAIPNLLRARLNANDNAMKKDLRTFSTGNESYRAAQNPPTYAPNINTLIAPATGPAYLDVTWSAATKHGFNLAYAVAADPAATYSMLTTPTTAGQSALNTYCVDQSGVVVGSINDGGASVPTGASTGCTGGLSIV